MEHVKEKIITNDQIPMIKQGDSDAALSCLPAWSIGYWEIGHYLFLWSLEFGH